MDYSKDLKETRWELLEFLQEYTGKLKLEENHEVVKEEGYESFYYYLKGDFETFVKEFEEDPEYLKEVLKENIENFKFEIELEEEDDHTGRIIYSKIELDLA